MREKTKHLRTGKAIMHIISIALCYLPLLIAIVTGFTYNEGVGKVTMSICCVFALLLTVINIIAKYSVRSTMWIMFIGIYTVLDNVMPYLIAIAICTVLDEFLVSPIYHSLKNRYIINKEIDTI